MPKDVHLFLLIHGLWGESSWSPMKTAPSLLTPGRPFHLAAAQYELESAWCEGDTPPQTPPDTLASDPLDSLDSLSGEDTPLLTPPYSPDPNTSSFTYARSVREDLVVIVAEGMTSQLTYDGVDVCASRVAWEVSQTHPSLTTRLPS